MHRYLTSALVFWLLSAGSLAVSQEKIGEVAGSPGMFDTSMGLIFSKDADLAYASNPGSGIVQEFQASTGYILGTLSLSPGLGSIALSPDGRTLAVLGVATQKIYIIDAQTMTLTRETGYEDSGFSVRNNLLFSPDNLKILVANASQNVCSPTGGCASSVAVLNVLDGSFDRLIPLARLEDFDRDMGINPTIMVPFPYPSRNLAVLCVGAQPGDPQTVYLIDAFGLGGADPVNLNPNFSVAPFNNIQATSGELVIPSYNDDRIGIFHPKNFALDVRLSVGKGPSKVAISPYGRFAAIVCEISKNIVLFTLPEGAPYDVPGIPGGVLPLPGLDVTKETTPVFSADERYLFIPSSSTDEIIVFDLFAKAVVKRIRVGQQPTLLSISPEGSALTSLDLGSNKLSLITMNPRTLYVHDLVQSNAEYSGVAVANFGAKTAAVALTARDNDGGILPGLNNPRYLLVSPNNQVALVGGEIFGFDFDEAVDGYIEANTTGADVTLLYMRGTLSQTQLDGFMADSTSGKLLGFSRITEGVLKFGAPTSTDIILQNPTDDDAQLQLSLYLETPTGPGTLIKYQEVTLKARGRISARVSDLLPNAFYPLEDGYLEVNSTQPITGMSRVTIGDGVAMIPASLRGVTETSFFAAQFVSGGDGPVYYSNLCLANTSPDPITFTAQVVDGKGKLIPAGSKPIVRTLQPYEAISGGADKMFGFPDPLLDPTRYEGTLELTADTPGLIADLLYGDARDGQFLTGQNLHAEKGTRFALGHVAQGKFGGGENEKSLYTGIAFYNPNINYANITVVAYMPTGAVSGKGILRLNAVGQEGSRLAQTLDQIIPEIKQQGGGTIIVTSDLPIFLFEVFGSSTADLLVAVPPVPINAP